MPVKLLAGRSSAAMSIGSGLVFSSVGHGAAFDIAGKGQASSDAAVAAIRLVGGIQ
ncbi:4-hydroxythreonine-4-phosphate dehydrogenase PdxA [Sulfitobacter sp. HI0129]|uniref:4-hydroxythreonine-4-phosphate dehydrogenase PdxA n=1 Tax=Sulfitobacter sp. HI0129 TaxID=1822268 RepID=UPI0022A924C2|nr:4-hydroxythreonine-4-phosphate dehydrogenase PdxA [Sulfitobacter sp. HI0129]